MEDQRRVPCDENNRYGEGEYPKARFSPGLAHAIGDEDQEQRLVPEAAVDGACVHDDEHDRDEEGTPEVDQVRADGVPREDESEGDQEINDETMNFESRADTDDEGEGEVSTAEEAAKSEGGSTDLGGASATAASDTPVATADKHERRNGAEVSEDPNAGGAVFLDDGGDGHRHDGVEKGGCGEEEVGATEDDVEVEYEGPFETEDVKYGQDGAGAETDADAAEPVGTTEDDLLHEYAEMEEKLPRKRKGPEGGGFESDTEDICDGSEKRSRE